MPPAGRALTISSAIALIAPASRFVRISMVALNLRLIEDYASGPAGADFKERPDRFRNIRRANL
jgi:hypothetical protein